MPGHYNFMKGGKKKPAMNGKKKKAKKVAKKGMKKR